MYSTTARLQGNGNYKASAFDCGESVATRDSARQPLDIPLLLIFACLERGRSSSATHVFPSVNQNGKAKAQSHARVTPQRQTAECCHIHWPDCYTAASNKRQASRAPLPKPKGRASTSTFHLRANIYTHDTGKAQPLPTHASSFCTAHCVQHAHCQVA